MMLLLLNALYGIQPRWPNFKGDDPQAPMLTHQRGIKLAQANHWIKGA